MKEKYRRKLEKAYELEGLLLLAMSKDEMPEGLEELIERKIEALMNEEANEEIRQETPKGGEPAATVPVEFAIRDMTADSGPADTFYALEDEETVPARKPARKEAPKGKRPVFSLNDRFLFLRELFNGDLEAFNASMDEIAGFSRFDEARDYCIRKFRLSPDENDSHSRFLEIVEKSFR